MFGSHSGSIAAAAPASIPRYGSSDAANVHPPTPRTAPERAENTIRLLDGFESLWSLVEIGAKAKQSGPGQIGSDIVDDDAADRAARKCRQNHADQATQRRPDPVNLRQIRAQPSRRSCRCNIEATRSRCCLLSRSLCPRPADPGQITRRPLPASAAARWSKSRPFLVRPCTHITGRISGRGSPIGKRDAMKAPPRQPSNRSHSVGRH